MAKYKLSYFNNKGRVEVSRLLFAAAGVEYEDIRVSWDEWPKLKSETPYGELPTLEVDGQVISQSVAISRYLARRFGLAGKTDWEEARADMVVDCVIATITHLGALFYERDPTQKGKLRKEFTNHHLPTNLAKLEKLLKSNNGGDGFFVGSEMTWADIFFTDFCIWPEPLGIDIKLSNYPKLMALRKRVEKVPKIADWIAKRPVTKL